MRRVTGIGGVFFKSNDPVSLAAWYRQHLGLEVQPWGGAVLRWNSEANPGGIGTTTWSPFPADTGYFAPSQAEFMINYRVDDVRALVETLRTEGVTVIGDVEASEFGLFAWILDPDGRKIELWQAPAGQ